MKPLTFTLSLLAIVGLAATLSKTNVITSVREPITAIITRYTASVDETDSEPHITANGQRVNKYTAACPENIKFGTIISVENETYVCMDRMSRRYRQGSYFDLIAETKQEAINWGRREIAIMVYN